MTEIIILTILFIIFIIFICLYVNSKESENYFIENAFEVIFDELNDNKKRYIFKKSCPTCKYAKKVNYSYIDENVLAFSCRKERFKFYKNHFICSETINDFIKTEYFPCSDWEIHPYITDLDLFFNNLEYTKIKYDDKLFSFLKDIKKQYYKIFDDEILVDTNNIYLSCYNEKNKNILQIEYKHYLYFYDLTDNKLKTQDKNVKIWNEIVAKYINQNINKILNKHIYNAL